MNVQITRHTDAFATAPQLLPTDLAELAALGFKTVINARPDGESADQPSSAAIEAAAQAAGLNYAHLPVVPGQITPTHGQQFAELLKRHPGPVLAFCRSGARAVSLHQLATGGIAG
jgi:uncharacterized protein (TIGR01244 family)